MSIEAGSIHPPEAQAIYREAMGLDAQNRRGEAAALYQRVLPGMMAVEAALNTRWRESSQPRVVQVRPTNGVDAALATALAEQNRR